MFCWLCDIRYKIYNIPEGNDTKIKNCCYACSKEPIFNQKRGLCQNCYSILRITKIKDGIGLKKISQKAKRRYGIKNMVKKYGIDILKDFKLLKKDYNLTLEIFGKKYGFTREYARILYKIVFGKAYTKALNKKRKRWRQLRDSTKDLVCKNNPKFKIAEYKKSSTMRQGALIEQKFIEECEKRNLNVEIPCKAVIDLKVNGFNVEVKSNGKSKLVGKAITKRYVFYISSSQIEKADFIACYHNRLDKFFIIPKKEISVGSLGKGGNISFSVNKTNHWCSKNRYWEFKDAFHLLRK